MHIDSHFPIDYDIAYDNWFVRCYVLPTPIAVAIPLASLVASQSRIERDRLHDVTLCHDGDMPIVVTRRADGRYSIRDGHHRAVHCKMIGRDTIMALVYD